MVRLKQSSAAALPAVRRVFPIFSPMNAGPAFLLPGAADNIDSASQLRLLLDLDEKLGTPNVDEAAVASDVDEFTKGSDKMKVHRQLYAAALLLQKR